MLEVPGERDGKPHIRNIILFERKGHKCNYTLEGFFLIGAWLGHIRDL